MEILFETDRLWVRELLSSDAPLFFDLMGNPNVMNPIPLTALNRQQSDQTLMAILEKHPNFADKKIWAVIEKNENEFIGFGGLLTNNEGDPEIAYRLREKFWGRGLGTELTAGIINYGKFQLHLKKIIADVNIENKRSIKILEKFMRPVREFHNTKDGGIDRRYELII